MPWLSLLTGMRYLHRNPNLILCFTVPDTLWKSKVWFDGKLSISILFYNVSKKNEKKNVKGSKYWLIAFSSHRSMSEMTVDFRRPDIPDNYSDVSSVYNYYQQQPSHHNRRGSSYYADDDGGSLVRSLSQPSLARSASEFTENWGVRIRSYEDGDDLSISPDHTPRSSFRAPHGAAIDGHRRHQQQHQQFSTAEYSTTSTTAATSATGAVPNRRMFGGRTVSAAEWFHDSDDNDATYK